MVSMTQGTTPHEPFWNDTVKDQCTKAKAFWNVWVKRHCNKCESFHLTAEDIAFLRQHEKKFHTATELFSKVRKLLIVDISKREEEYEYQKRQALKDELRDLVLFDREEKEEYREITGQRRINLWEHQRKTQEMIADKEGMFVISFLIDELEVNMNNGPMPEGSCRELVGLEIGGANENPTTC